MTERDRKKLGVAHGDGKPTHPGKPGEGPKPLEEESPPPIPPSVPGPVGP